MPAYDNSAYAGFVTGVTNQTTSYTVGAGANGCLIISALGDATSDLLTTAIYNGTPATLIAKQNSAPGSVFWQYVWVLLNPTVGTANVVVSASSIPSVIQTCILSLTDVKATGVEAFTTASGSGDPFTTNITTLSANAWAVEFVNASVGIQAGSGFITRASDATPTFTAALGTQAVTTAGATSMGVTGGGGLKQSIILALPTATVVTPLQPVLGGMRTLVYAPSVALTASLASLASSATLVAGVESAPVDNSSTKVLDYFLSGKITTGTTPTVGTIEVWCVPELDDSSWPDVFDGTSSAETSTTRTILQGDAQRLWFMLTDTTSNRTYYMPKTPLSPFYGGSCPRKFVLFVTHNTGVALHATAGNHALYQQAITENFDIGSATNLGTVINVGDTWQTAVTAGVANQTFLIKAGTHRLQSVTPKAGQRFIGETGAVMSGASLLPSASFTVSGAFWKIGSQTQAPGARDGFCQAAYPGCNYREELFMDNIRKVHVQTLAEVGAGTWFFDYATDEITVGDNPAGHVVETSITTMAFTPGIVNNVTIRNLTIEKYASQAQYGAINCEGTTGWSVADCILRLNHGGAIRIGTGLQLYRCLITLNGQEGVVGIGDDVIIDGNEISYNNDAHFSQGWEAGGTKFVQTNRLIVRNNYVHHNDGPGLWTDIDNINVLYENNIVEDNQQIGIFHEISWACIIRNNQVRRNGFGSWVPAGYVWGAGILVAASADTEVYGNIVEDNNGSICAVQQNRTEPSPYGAHLVTNLNVHDNTVKHFTGYIGVVEDSGDTQIFTTRNNHYEANTYSLAGATTWFAWADQGYLSFAAWQGYGNDTPVGSASIY